MSAREEIMGRVRAGLGQRDLAARKASALEALAKQALGPQPQWGGDLKTRFASKAESLSSTHECVAAWAEVPGAVERYLAQRALPREVVLSPALTQLDWSSAGIEAAGRGARDADQVGVTGCFCAVAETGTLLLLSGAASPATVSLLPETHIAIVPVSRILATMEAAFALVRKEHGELPRALSFISGPSRTGDIEQTIVLGAHGPCRVHLILVDEA